MNSGIAEPAVNGLKDSLTQILISPDCNSVGSFLTDSVFIFIQSYSETTELFKSQHACAGLLLDEPNIGSPIPLGHSDPDLSQDRPPFKGYKVIPTASVSPQGITNVVQYRLSQSPRTKRGDSRSIALPKVLLHERFEVELLLDNHASGTPPRPPTVEIFNHHPVTRKRNRNKRAEQEEKTYNACDDLALKLWECPSSISPGDW
ncbi:hypothetical protein B0H14DRAFT_2654082 [Mycena olivaceomarginata]|nr:hypothetical protein B0H14DRAFT_2654082 [Mycena olivaceomarginata]